MRTDHVLSDGWQICKTAEWDGDLDALISGEPGGSQIRWHAAQVPTGLHEVLLRDGDIADPSVGRNAAEADWVGDEDWVYRTRFTTPSGAGRSYLRFKGVDTLAEVYLNGERILSIDNMFREYEVAVGDLLTSDGTDNVLVVLISSASRYVSEQVVRPETHRDAIPPHFYIRKGGGDFSSYLGARPRLVKAGVYRDVVLTTVEDARLTDIRARTASVDEHAAVVTVDVSFDGAGAQTSTIEWALADPDGRLTAHGTASPSGSAGPGGRAGSSQWQISVPEPRLWWPRGYGQAALYSLRVTLLDEHGEAVDERAINLGIRTVELFTREPRTGETRFAVHVNGVPIHLRGGNWAQVQGISNVWDSSRARRLFDLAELAGMNVLRVWGGGIIPEDEFYQECDSRGILVWQDFMLEYGVYPWDQAAFARTLEAEMAGMVTRLRNHPSIFLWCGGNESHMGWDFRFGGDPEVGAELFTEAMPRICAALDGTRPFHANSPFGGPVANWPLEGDWHDYRTVTFSPRASVPTFVSEMGRVSAPSLASMKKFLSPEELWPDGHDASIRTPGQASWPPMWGYRAPDGAWQKIGAIENYPEPLSAEDYVRALGTAHGEYLRTSVERHRRGRPDGDRTPGRRNGGDIVWRLNDPWPILYWSVIDAYLEPKIPFYFLKRAYEPVLVSFEQTADELAVWVTNDSAAPAAGTLLVERVRFDGTILAQASTELQVEPGQSVRAYDTVDFGPIPLRTELIRARFNDAPAATWTLIAERYLELPQATLTVARDGNRLSVTTDAFARQITFESPDAPGGAIFSDNYFDLTPGESVVIELIGETVPREVSIGALNAPRSVIGLP